MPAIQVTKSILIEAPMDRVFGYIVDFNHWLLWSPWLLAEPDAVVAITNEGRSYHWRGEIVGEGKIDVVRIDESGPTKRVECALEFLRPFRSRSQTGFLLASEGENTRVEWNMKSSLPFFLFWMKDSMKVWIGMDYKRGLLRLKDLCEKGEVLSSLEVPGLGRMNGFHYLGLEGKAHMDEMGKALPAAFERLFAHCPETSGSPTVLYRKWDLKNQVGSFTACLPIESPWTRLPEGLIVGQVPDSAVYRILHTGPYHHIGNAWSVGMSHRKKRYKGARHMPPMERYLNDPTKVPPREYLTEVLFPTK